MTTDAEIESAIAECQGRVPFAANILKDWLRERRMVRKALENIAASGQRIDATSGTLLSGNVDTARATLADIG